MRYRGDNPNYWDNVALREVIGINPDYFVHVRNDILEETDGPMLKHGLQSLDNQKIILPYHRRNYPDSDRLQKRYVQFRKRFIIFLIGT